MKKSTYIFLAMTIFVLVIASACSAPAAPATQLPAPAVAAPVDAAAPTQQSAPAQTFAPACQAAASCAAPDVKDTVAADHYCVQKIPYQNIPIAEGVTFEVLDPGKLTCLDNGTIVDGKHVVECHGTEGWASQVKFTNSACGGGASLVAGSDQCEAGLGYDAAQNCCAPISSGDAGSVTITVNMGVCD